MQDTKQPTILCVDDNPTNLSVLFDFLNEAGYRIAIAQDGQSAVNRSELIRPDIILLDIMMPETDGYETCQLLKTNPVTKDIPIIFITALSEPDDKIKGFKLGAVDYITKPFHQEEVLARITTHLTIQRQQQELVELNAMKNRFFSIISHDMRNAFNAFLGNSELLICRAKSLQDEKLMTYTRNLYDSLEKTHRMMENLQKWARIQLAGDSPTFQRIDLNQPIKRALDMVQDMLTQKSIQLINTVSEKTYVYADAEGIEVILRNLLLNAIKFTYPHGHIYIRSESVELSSEGTDVKGIKLIIQDTGCGISAEDVRKLFRIDQKFKREGTLGEKGSGLGLILCKEIIQQNCGSIGVESTPGKGTMFWFSLPDKE
ncbi:MAG: hybrid sensor histidine kinase/response regulator [Desulfobacterales bacterium]|nr:hybrid sensor histidine kinase/response regulator [Desulfobacterales bacterium]